MPSRTYFILSEFSFIRLLSFSSWLDFSNSCSIIVLGIDGNGKLKRHVLCLCIWKLTRLSVSLELFGLTNKQLYHVVKVPCTGHRICLKKTLFLFPSHLLDFIISHYKCMRSVYSFSSTILPKVLRGRVHRVSAVEKEQNHVELPSWRITANRFFLHFSKWGGDPRTIWSLRLSVQAYWDNLPISSVQQ